MQLRPLKSFAQHFANAPVRETELVQLGPGDINLKDCWIYGENSFVNTASSKARSSWTVLGRQDLMALMLPLSWDGDYRVNGWYSDPGDVYLLDGEDEYCNVGQDRKVLFIAFERRRMTREVASLSRRTYDELPRGHNKFQIGLAAAENLSKIAGRAFQNASPLDQGGRRFGMSRGVESEFFAQIAQWILSLNLHSNCTHVLDKAAFKNVRLARGAITRTPADQLTISTLCRVAGVGRSQLHENFVEIFGESPWQYILKRRLTSVREHLLDVVSTPRSVKDTALMHSFFSGGHFAKEYQSMFGELPSETLKKTLTEKSQL
ncbi:MULTISPECIES: helix-turn-helix domain-containing protein [Ruegeria]|uniref:helix-turn-helix domain-containing protein n=1 Tax=Ruegeria TaxID=97050 RepID=UPI0014803502|nr:MULTISPECIES: helix-turn-helix domain-containing protein [Ruegeria]